MIESADSIEPIIIALLEGMVPKGTCVNAQTRLAHDLGLDSVAMMNFTLALEERLEITIPLEHLVEIETVSDLGRVVEALVRPSKFTPVI